MVHDSRVIITFILALLHLCYTIIKAIPTKAKQIVIHIYKKPFHLTSLIVTSPV